MSGDVYQRGGISTDETHSSLPVCRSVRLSVSVSHIMYGFQTVDEAVLV